MPLTFARTPDSFPAWEEYARQFRRTATKHNRSPEHINSMLTYARQLHSRGLPIVYDCKHLSQLVGYDTDYLFAVANNPVKFYRKFQIRKKNGKTRELNEPLPSLKEIQHWILRNVLEKINVSKYAHGFLKGKSIKHNARFHRGQAVVLCMDVKDFFPSISVHRVYWLFLKCGYTRSVAMLLARLCTLNNAIPQGSPTSPAISNVVAFTIDQRLGGFAVKSKLRYTRYADDITFSGEFDAGPVIGFACYVLKDCGFEANDEKTRVMYSNQRQIVTGVVVNEKLQVTREMRMRLRQAVHYIARFGLGAHMQNAKITKSAYVPYLLGIASFIFSINPKDRDALKAFAVLKPLLRKFGYVSDEDSNLA